MKQILVIGDFPDHLSPVLNNDSVSLHRVADTVAAWPVLRGQLLRKRDLPDAILCCSCAESLWSIQKLCTAIALAHPGLQIPLMLLSNDQSAVAKKLYRELPIFDVLQLSVPEDIFQRRLLALLDQEPEKADPSNNPLPTIPVWKRAMDIAGASLLILLLSPLFILVALLIKVESRGPITYAAKRAGRGFQIFPFYKFRSMRPDADKLLAKMKHLNQYQQKTEDVSPESIAPAGPVLIEDAGEIAENQHQLREAAERGSTFVKIPNDPRITRVGKFIRNTSIDELPQLFNVLFGHMSLVGNRPLPLYEAEQLTSDEWIERFDAPAGITGLWQVTERGKENVTPEGRIQLDIEYARNYSLWLDLKILFRTLPAAVQKVGV